jgi:membrane protein YdbS with pleckstrin-like domain
VKALQDEYLRDASVVIVMVPAMAGVMTMVIDVYVGFIVAIIALIVTIWASCLYMLRKAAQVANGHMFRVTDEELVIKHGDGTKVTSMIPLADIVEVGVVETKYSAKYGLKSVYVDTGGFGGQTMMGLRDAESVAEAILSRVKKAQAITKAA